MEEVFIILDFLQADEEFFAPVIRADVNKKQAWKNYDGSEDPYKYYVHNEKYQEILKRELVQKLNSTHFALSQMKENSIVLRHGGLIISVVIATDNSFVVTGSSDGTAKIWRGLKEINALDLELPQILLLLKLATSDSKIDLSKETEEFRAIYESLPENVKTAFDEYNRRSWWSKIKRPLAVGSIIAAAYLGYKLFKNKK